VGAASEEDAVAGSARLNREGRDASGQIGVSSALLVVSLTALDATAADGDGVPRTVERATFSTELDGAFHAIDAKVLTSARPFRLGKLPVAPEVQSFFANRCRHAPGVGTAQFGDRDQCAIRAKCVGRAGSQLTWVTSTPVPAPAHHLIQHG
jgi:hypothetical protein